MWHERRAGDVGRGAGADERADHQIAAEAQRRSGVTQRRQAVGVAHREPYLEAAEER